MKKLIAIVFFAASFSSQAQTRLDTLVFDKVNEYRLENKLQPIKWSTLAGKVARNQAEYCSRIKYVLHDQTDSTVNDSTFQVEPDFEKRFTRYGIPKIGEDWVFAENLLVNVDSSNTKTLEQIAEETLQGWKDSPAHNSMMLLPTIQYASIAHVISDKYAVTSFDLETMTEYTSTFKGTAYYIALDAYK